MHFKVVFPICIADAPARAMLKYFKQFNGSSGYCLHEGISIQKGWGYSLLYPMKHPLPQKRTHSESLSNAIAVVEQGQSEINGVKGPSYLYLFHFLI